MSNFIDNKVTNENLASHQNVKTDSFVELTLNDLHSLHDTPFLKEQNRFRIQIPGVTNKSGYNDKRLLTLLNNPSVIELANTIYFEIPGNLDTILLSLNFLIHNIKDYTKKLKK